MKKLPMIMLLAGPYALLIGILFSNESGIFLKAGVIIYIMVLLFNMIYAFLLPRLGFDEKQILFWNMLLKLCHIPVYLFLFLIVLLMHVFIIPLLPFLFLFDYLLLLASSAYGISGLLRCYKMKEINKKILIVNIVSQLIFCTDVFSSIYCYKKISKLKVYGRQLSERLNWETVIEMMYDNGLDAFEDEVINVIYSKDKSMRYVILKDEQSIFTYQLEAIYQYDDEEWSYLCDSNSMLPAMWEPHSNGWSGSKFANIEDLMKELIYEPEYKVYF